MTELTSVRAVANGGLLGDRWYRPPWTYPLRLLNAWRKRQRFGWSNITLITLADIDAGNAMLPEPFTPMEMRRNVVIDGPISLNDTLGVVLRIGEVLVVADNLCTPCGFPPMRARKKSVTSKEFNRAFGHPNPIFGGGVNRGGVRCRIVRGGVIRVGDIVSH